jgi:hypothetical protein
MRCSHDVPHESQTQNEPCEFTGEVYTAAPEVSYV